MDEAEPHMLILSVSDDRPGHEQQAKALAQALCRHAESLPLGKKAATKHVTHVLPSWQRWLAPYGSFFAKKAVDAAFNHAMPDVVVGCGRQAAVALRVVKKQWPNVRTVQVFNLQKRLNDFDVLCVPSHDAMPDAPHVVPFHAALSPINADWLRTQSKDFEDVLPDPSALTVLLGGSRDGAEYLPDFAEALRKQIIHLLGDDLDWQAVHLIVSRRTPAQALNAWAAVLPQANWHQFAPGERNLYPGLLARSNQFIVTADSASMLADAHATGRPVHVAAGMTLAGKPKRWVDALAQTTTKTTDQAHPMQTQTNEVARQVWALLGFD